MADRVTESLPGVVQALLSVAPEGINPWRAYPTKEAAVFLGLDPSTLSKISEHELPRERVGPSRGSVVYFGINILCYLVGLEPVDVKALVEQLRSDLLREARRPSKVQSLPKSRDRTRIL